MIILIPSQICFDSIFMNPAGPNKPLHIWKPTRERVGSGFVRLRRPAVARCVPRKAERMGSSQPASMGSWSSVAIGIELGQPDIMSDSQSLLVASARLLDTC